MSPEDHIYFSAYSAAVERNLFVELLTKVSRFHALDQHAYISMSGYGMDDHKLMSRHLGISRLLAFDYDQTAVFRQMFNRAVEGSRFRNMSYSELSADLTTVLEHEGLDDSSGLIIWLRELRSDRIGNLARDFIALAGALPINSIVHLTLNADFEDWAGTPFEGGVRLSAGERRERALNEIRAQLGHMITTEVGVDDMTSERLPGVIAQAFSIAASRAIGSSSGTVFEALSLLQFDARKPYLSVVGMIINQSDRPNLREIASSGRWPFVSENWTDVKHLKLPDLTVRERLSLELHAGEGREVVNRRLQFDIEEATEQPGFIEHFARFHHYYPVFLKAEL